MKLVKVIIFCFCVIFVSTPLVFAICNGTNVVKTETANFSSGSSANSEEDLAECISERDRLLEQRDYKKAFSYCPFDL